jgi:hypothetical protein
MTRINVPAVLKTGRSHPWSSTGMSPQDICGSRLRLCPQLCTGSLCRCCTNVVRLPRFPRIHWSLPRGSGQVDLLFDEQSRIRRHIFRSVCPSSLARCSRDVVLQRTMFGGLSTLSKAVYRPRNDYRLGFLGDSVHCRPRVFVVNCGLYEIGNISKQRLTSIVYQRCQGQRRCTCPNSVSLSLVSCASFSDPRVE